MFIRNNCIVLIYVDDCIVISLEKQVIDAFVKSMQNVPEKFIFSDGVLAPFLAVEIDYKDDGSIEMTQPH